MAKSITPLGSKKIEALLKELRSIDDLPLGKKFAKLEQLELKFPICDGGCIAISPVPPCSGCCIRKSPAS